MASRTAKAFPEVWGLVAASGELQTRDVNALCLASKHFLHSCRPALYRGVILRDSHPHLKETVELLKSDAQLSAKVKELHLVTSKKSAKSTSTWIDMDMFTTLKHLNAVLLMGWPFLKSAEQDRFSAVVSEHCLALEAFCHVIQMDLHPNNPFPGPRLCIPRLKVIIWNALIEEHCPLIDLARASASTVVEISLFKTSLAANATSPFFSLTFPKLRNISLGPPDEHHCINDMLVSFLTRHPTLERLSLHNSGALLSLVGLPATACPNLKHLSARVMVLAELLDARVGFLETLESLSTGPLELEVRESKLELDILSLALAGYGQLPAVTFLEFKDWGFILMDKPHLIEPYLTAYAKSFPNLRTWYGSLPENNDARIRILSSFPKLEGVAHNWSFIPSSILRLKPSLGTPPEEYIRKLAAELPLLKRIGLYSRRMFDNESVTFQVDRCDEVIELRVLNVNAWIG